MRLNSPLEYDQTARSADPGLKRLAIVCFEDARNVTGGVQRRIAAEVAYFSGRGIEVTVICAGDGSCTGEGNVTYITLPTPSIPYPARTLIFSYRAARLLCSLPAFDVVETHHDAGAAGLLAGRGRGRNRAARMQRAVFVEVVHGVFRDEFASVRKSEGLFSRGTLGAIGMLPLALVERLAVHRADAVITVSDYCARQVARWYGAPRHPIAVIPNGIDPERYSARTEEGEGESFPSSRAKACEIVFVGRWHARKGVMPLLRAFSVARAAVPALRLTMIGGGPLEAELHTEAAALGVEPYVTFEKGLSDSEIVTAYRRAAIVCIPSLQEGQGIVALEAQACGAPLVVTRAGGLPEAVVEGQTALVVEPDDVQALAMALMTMAQDGEMRRLFGANAVEWTGGFSWARMLAPVEDLYTRLAETRRSAQPRNHIAREPGISVRGAEGIG